MEITVRTFDSSISATHWNIVTPAILPTSAQANIAIKRSANDAIVASVKVPILMYVTGTEPPSPPLGGGLELAADMIVRLDAAARHRTDAGFTLSATNKKTGAHPKCERRQWVSPATLGGHRAFMRSRATATPPRHKFYGRGRWAFRPAHRSLAPARNAVIL